MSFLRFRPLLIGLALAGAGAGAALAAGPKAYIGNFQDSTVSVLDVAAARVVATVPVAQGPDGIAVTPDGTTAFVSGSGAAALSVIDTATDQVAAAIAVGQGPQGLALTPDGRQLLVAVNGDDKLAFVDVATRRVLAAIELAKPHTVAVQPDGKRAYVSSQQPGAFALVVVDLAQRRVVGRIALDKPPRDLEFDPTGKELFVTLAGVAAVQVVDIASDRIVAQVPTGVSPHLAQHYAGLAQGVAVVQGPGRLEFFDVASRTVTRNVPVGKQPHWMDITGDRRQLLVTNEGADSVSIVDLGGAPTVEVPVGRAPRKVAVQQGAAVTGAAKAAGATQPEAQVSIANFAFAPTPITVAPGQRVTWRNDDGAPHGVAYADKSAGQDLLLPGKSFSRRFDKPGVYDYICSVHPYMTGRVVVTAR